MMTMILGLILAACGVAGADDGRGPLEARSGSRLKVRYWEGADGSRLPVGLYDTELGLDCEPMLTSDGVYRCLPTGLVHAPEYPSDPEKQCWADEEMTKLAWDGGGEPGVCGTWIPMEAGRDTDLYCIPVAPKMVLSGYGSPCGTGVFEVVEIDRVWAWDGWAQEWAWQDAFPPVYTLGPMIPFENFVEIKVTPSR